MTAPPKSRYAAREQTKSKIARGSGAPDQEESGDDDVLSEISEELDYGDEDEEMNDAEASGADENEEDDDVKVDSSVIKKKKKSAEKKSKKVDAAAAEVAPETSKIRREQERKRKRKDENADLEGKYLAQLTKDEEDEPIGKRQKGEAKEEDGSDSGSENDVDDDDDVPVHESLKQDGKKPTDIEKAARTIFLANVSSEAISSKSAKKTLLKHLSSVLDKDATPPQKIESIRFRSVAFSTGSMPKRAAYITKSLMEATTKSTNAYVVLSTEAAARKIAVELNGSEVLERHIRVDSVAHPSPMDHRRCLFVGNLGFVDDETVIENKGDGKLVEKKRNKIPSDIEEGLWRTFGTQGKVENVRVIRDPTTRVGKGFAYVQFYVSKFRKKEKRPCPGFTPGPFFVFFFLQITDRLYQDANDVESALLLDGKKFPPMLPRVLRVARAKDPRKTTQAMEKVKAKAEAAGGPVRGGSNKYQPKLTPEDRAAAGRANKLLGRAGAAQLRRQVKNPHMSSALPAGFKSPENIVFEGRRASSKDGIPRELKGKKAKKKSGRPQNRGSQRAASWKQKK